MAGNGAHFMGYCAPFQAKRGNAATEDHQLRGNEFIREEADTSEESLSVIALPSRMSSLPQVLGLPGLRGSTGLTSRARRHENQTTADAVSWSVCRR